MTPAIRSVRNPKKVLDIGFIKTEPNQRQNSTTENLVNSVKPKLNQKLHFLQNLTEKRNKVIFLPTAHPYHQ